MCNFVEYSRQTTDMEHQDTRIKLCPDGKYCRGVEVPIFSNQAVFYDLVKAMLPNCIFERCPRMTEQLNP